MENLMMDWRASAELERLMDDMLAFNLRWIDKWRCWSTTASISPTIGRTGPADDSAAVWRKLFKPRYAEMFKKGSRRRYGRLVPLRRSHQRHF
jgi:hypothetical protein